MCCCAGRDTAGPGMSKRACGSSGVCNGRNYLTSTIVITPAAASWVSGLPWSSLLRFSLDHITVCISSPICRWQVVDERTHGDCKCPQPEQVWLTIHQRAPWWQPDHPVPSWSSKPCSLAILLLQVRACLNQHPDNQGMNPGHPERTRGDKEAIALFSPRVQPLLSQVPVLQQGHWRTEL